MDPGANELAGKGSTVTLFVSKGPKESAVPDVTSFTRGDAIATLRNSGFKVEVQITDTQDPAYDNAVMSQSPGPGESAKPGTTVTITVGQYVPPVTEPTTIPTDTTPTDTTSTDTTPVTP